MKPIMHKLYWKIFLSFWGILIVTIIVIAWFIANLTHRYTITEHQRLISSAYANAAVMLHENKNDIALKHWLNYLERTQHMKGELIDSDGKNILGGKLPVYFEKIAHQIKQGTVNGEFIKRHDSLIVELVNPITYKKYFFVLRLMPRYEVFLKFHWRELIIHVLIAVLLSGIICYFLSLYLTRPLQQLQKVAKNLGEGKLRTRVDKAITTRKDEIGDLGVELDHMSERLEDLLESQKRLLWDVSHELRSPLARLEIALGLAKKKAKGLAEAEHERILIEAERLDQFIGEILTLAKMETYQSNKLSKKSIKLNHLLESVVSDANYELGEDKSLVEISNPSEIIIININETLLRRAIDNIIRNALFYSNHESPVTLSTTQKADGIIISIRDHGPGVDEEKLENIFESFYRVDESRTQKSGGIGLGLAIANKGVTLHGGNIKAENHPEGGLNIKIFVPF